MPWVILYVALGVTGIAVLALFGYRVWREARALAQAVAAASQRLTDAAAELETASRRPARPAGGSDQDVRR